MIWDGETYEQRIFRLQQGIETFAWLPRQMMDGRWVWLQRHWTALHLAPNQRKYWVSSLDKYDCIQRGPCRPPLPTPRPKLKDR
jgi:hypothetical protein